MTTKELLALAGKVGELILTQDNRITAEPIFIVQQVREFVADADYDNDGIVWVDEDGSKADDEQAAGLEADFNETCDTPEGWRRLAVKQVWEFVTACFTEQGCKDYIVANGHNLRRPRIYAEGSFRNAEWRAVRNHLSALPALCAEVEALQRQVGLLRETLGRAEEYLPMPPERNCSCHLSPPCCDCVDNSDLRDLHETIAPLIKEPK